LHCVAPFDLPELAPYLERFNDGARQHEDELYAVAANSADASERSMALFVLAHTNDAQRLAPVLGRAIYDPNGGVRNNAMRVLMFLAQSGADVDFPVRDLIAALDFPNTADRNKAGYTVAALAEQPKYRDTIRAEAVPAALRLLRLEKLNNHEPAYQILTRVSGESFGERDYAAWERWAASR
jgi:HEAT repeat protein